MYYKKLVGKKCYLSPIDENDAEKFTGWLNDLELTVNFGNNSRVFSVEIELLNQTSETGLFIENKKTDYCINSIYSSVGFLLW
jgi:hypothetical protein